MELRGLFISLVLFSGIIVGMSAFYGDLTSAENLAYYGYTQAEIDAINPEDLSSMDIIDDITAQTEQMETTLNTDPTGIPIIDYGWKMVNMALNSFELLFGSTFLFTNLITESVNTIGLPPFIIGVVMAVIILIFIFEFISARLRYRV